MRAPQLVISCHADTGFVQHRLARHLDGTVTGHLDNFAGVYCVMQAYFGGLLDAPDIRIELTEGEEVDMAGAKRVLRTLQPDDVVLVVDVTGIPTERDFTIEKCVSPLLRRFLERSLEGLSYELHEDCPDPISNQDECNVYQSRLPHVCFIGIPCQGGDYNAGEVQCRTRSLSAVSDALGRMARGFAGLQPALQSST